MALIGRFAVIVFAYICAVFAAALLLNALILATLGVLPDPVDDGFSASLWVATPFMALIISFFAFWPALAMIALGEYFAKRDSLFYSLSGLIIALILSVLGYQSDLQNDLQDAPELFTLMSMAASGIVGGFVYWLITGRNAGCATNSKNAPDESAN